MAALGQCRPFFVPGQPASGAVKMGDIVRIHLDLTAFALDDDGVVAEQCAGLAVCVLISGVEDTLQPQRAERIEQARQRVNRRAQAEQVAHVDHALQHRHPGAQRNEREIALVQCSADLLPVLAATDAQQLAAVRYRCARRWGATAVHEDAHAVGCQAPGCEQVPGQVAFLASVAWPVQVDSRLRRLHPLAYRFGESGQLFGAFFLVPQQHEEGAELGLLGLAVEQHAHGFAGFFTRQVAGATFALAEDAHIHGEGVFGRSLEDHRQLLGFGSPPAWRPVWLGCP